MGRLFLALVLIAQFCAKPVFAYVSDYGFGPHSAALAGMNAVASSDGFAAYTNPARVGKGLSKKKVFRAGYGVSLLVASFEPISDVIVENPVMSSTSTNRYSDYDPSVSDGLGQWIGGEYLIMPDKNLAIGFASFIPLNGLAQIDTGPIYHPEYVLFRTRWQRPKIAVSGSYAPSEFVRLGAGVDVGFSAAANADIFLQAGAGNASDQRLTTKMKPSISPLFGIEIDAGGFEVGGVFRWEQKTDLTLETTGGARLFGSLNASVDFGYTSKSMLAYDPFSFEFGIKTPPLGPFRGLFELDYQLWSKGTLPPALINTAVNNDCQNVPSGGTCNSFQPTITPDGTTRDILIPKVGAEIDAGAVVLRTGYSYRPSVFTGLPTGAGNMIDPSRHLFAAGIEIPVKDFIKVDIHGQVQSLVHEVVIKTDGNEFGNGTGEQKIGAPGYPIGGTVYGGGLSVVVEL